jgi:hypothetical protein
MFKSGMLCTRIDKVSSGKLSDSPQTLKDWSVYEILLYCRESEVSMNGISDFAIKSHYYYATNCLYRDKIKVWSTMKGLLIHVIAYSLSFQSPFYNVHYVTMNLFFTFFTIYYLPFEFPCKLTIVLVYF